MMRALACAVLLAWTGAARAEGPAPQPTACAAAEHRAFDFWLGAWRVETPNGQLAGHNTITKVLGGCALLEQWEGARGFRGTSLNAWDASTRRWRQTWMDASGAVLRLEGGIEGGAMVLRGVSREEQGERLERITWTPLEGGAVRQHWQQSRDGGESWTDAFVGIYRRR
jgi:hypothetical protein